MPGLPEDPREHRGSLLDQVLDIRVPRHALGVGIGAEGTEAQGEALLIRRSDRLVAEVDHLVAEQGLLYLQELPFAHLSDIDTLDLGAHGAGQGNGGYLGEAEGLIVVLIGWVELHSKIPCWGIWEDYIPICGFPRRDILG